MKNFLKIAVCDDSSLDRTIEKLYLEEYLNGHGISFSVREFTKGEDFLSSDLAGFDLAFLDIYMEGLNGIETAQNILKINPNIKIMFCSASPEFCEEAADMAAFRYFIKPLSKEKFIKSMDELFK